jgi:hypothetical protein
VKVRVFQPSLEHHHCDRTPRKRVANDQLGYDIQSNLLVSDGLNHSYGYGVDKCFIEKEKENEKDVLLCEPGTSGERP